MREIVTVARTRAHQRIMLALTLGALAILPALLAGCQQPPQPVEPEQASPQSAAVNQASQLSAVSDDAAAVAAIERIAGELPMFEPRQFIYYGRTRSWDCREEDISAQYTRCMTELVSLDISIDALIDLLEHDDPKMRTLAIALLIDKGDPSALPHIAELLDDDAPTYRIAEGTREAWPRPYVPTVWAEQTVGDVAEVALAVYCRQSPRFSSRDRTDRSSFDAYWATYKDLPYCASWFAVKLMRASRGTSPTQDEWAADIRRVREQIDAIPGDDRAWTLLWLYGEAGSDALVSEAELIEMCQQLGPEKLLAMLRNEIPSDDPDIQPGGSGTSWWYRRMSLFVLQRAEQLFDPSHAQALLACEQLYRSETGEWVGPGLKTPYWAIAAARLQPDDAADILLPAMGRFQGRFDDEERMQLAVTIWELAGESQLDFLTEWFYNEAPEDGTRAKFLQNIMSRGDPLARRTIAGIVSDPGIDSVDVDALVTILRRVNGWTDAPVVSAMEMRTLKQRMNELSMGRAYSEYTEETAEVYRTLDDWRARLRVSLPQWAPAEDE